MKNITKALSENRPIATRGWWGTIKNNNRYLMRYNHIMLVINSSKKIVYMMNPHHMTITDSNGVLDAIKQIESEEFKVL